MPKVTVFNDNVHPLREMFKGDPVEIAAKDYWRDAKGEIREVDFYEATEFKGQYRPMPSDGSGHRVEDSKYHKILKITPVDAQGAQAVTEVVMHKCMARECRFVGSDATELANHTIAKHGDAERLVMPEADAEIETKKRVGRPPKTA